MINFVRRLFASKTPLVIDPNVPTINVINQSTRLSEADFQLMVEACQIQMEKHVAPMWQRGKWNIVANQPETAGYPIVILDNSDQAGALGYHSKTPGGKVWGRVFVNPVLNAKGSALRSGPLSVSAILSHEIIEAYLDPNVNLWVDNGRGTLIAYEACDPVETNAYDITTKSGAKVCVSNFVLPSWFDHMSDMADKFDFMAKVSAPLTVSKGGYMITMDPKTGATKSVFGEENSPELHAARQEQHEASRSTRKTSLAGS